MSLPSDPNRVSFASPDFVDTRPTGIIRRVGNESVGYFIDCVLDVAKVVEIANQWICVNEINQSFGMLPFRPNCIGERQFIIKINVFSVFSDYGETLHHLPS